MASQTQMFYHEIETNCMNFAEYVPVLNQLPIIRFHETSYDSQIGFLSDIHYSRI